MCILDACCYCVFLDIGCILIAVLILVFRIIVIVLMLHDPTYKDINFTEDFSAVHATIILAAVGCIIPVFLMFGVCTSSPGCVCSFIILETIYVLVNIIWEMYFIIKHYSKESRFTSYYDFPDSYDHNYYAYDDSYDELQDKYNEYFAEDLFWLAPLIFFLMEGYFLWVAYSYYRFLQYEEYDDFYRPAVFYT